MFKQKNSLFFFTIIIMLKIILSTDPGEELREAIKDMIQNSLISGLSTSGGGISLVDNQNAGYCGHISYINDQLKNSCTEMKLPQINITNECRDKIIEKYKDSGATNIIVTSIFKKNNFAQNTENYKAGIYGITDIIAYQFFVCSANAIISTEIEDIKSICSENVVLFSPLYLSETLKNKFTAVAGQNPKSEIEYLRNYDIFDPDSKIYKDICYPITYSLASENIINEEESFKNYDISLYERKLHYFPGKVYLCPDGCEYLGTDKETLSPMCECEFQFYKKGLVNVDTHNSYTGFEFDEEKFNKTKKDNYLTIETFKCIKLPFTKAGFKSNYGSYIIIALIAIVLLSYLILLISGKHHLLSVLELLYNSNIKSMNYIKNPGLANNLQNQNQIPFDARSNNYLLSSQRGIATNGLLMSNVLTGNNYINAPNKNNDNFNKVTPIQVGKNKNNSKNNIQIIDKKLLNKNNPKKKEKIDVISNVDEEQENELESDKNSMGKDKTDIGNSKSTDKNNKDEDKIVKKNSEKDGDNEKEKEKKENKKESESEEEEKDNDNKDKNKEKDDEEEEEDDEEEEENDKKANPPKKNYIKYINCNKPHPPKKKNSNGNEEVERKTKKNKTKSPIEIALNVKDLREMMFKNQQNGNPLNNNNNMPLPMNGYNYNPYMNNMGFMPPPPFGGGYPFNEDAIRKEYENKARQRELEFKKELADLKDSMYERERQRQRDLDYERDRRRDRDDNYRDRYYDRDRNEDLARERERLKEKNEEIEKMKEKLQKEYDEKQNKNKEKDLELEKELMKAKDLTREKEIEFEKELLKQKQALKEQYEKENKEIIEKKDREIQLLREEKDREIQRIKEDKDREIKLLKEDMDREKKIQDEKIKKKEKEFKKEKQKVKELQKGLTSNSFFMNGTTQQQIFDINNSFNKYEKIETPQIVVPIDSIFTDQELNAMDFDNSCIYDKRTLCQIYFSFINRKQPLFFLFNYNSSSSSSISTFQINYGSVKFIFFCIEIMIYFFFYASFFGSKSITHILKHQFNFKKRCVFAIIISPICMIVKSIIHHFLYDNINKKIAEIKMRCYTNFLIGKKKDEVKVNEFKDFWESDEDKNKEEIRDKKEEMEDIQEIEDDNLPEEEKARRKDKYEKRKLKILIKELIAIFKRKMWISFIIVILAMFIEWYYITAFCAVYKNTQLNFFINILISFLFSNIIPFIYCLIPTIFRQDGVREQSKFAFFIYKIFQLI